MAHSTPLTDISLIIFTALFTSVLSRQVKPHLARSVTGWEKLPPHVRARLAMELASVPARFTLGLVIAPVVYGGFRPVEEWRPRDTEMCLAVCAILTGTYAPNLLVSRSRLSTLHYTMPLFLLLAIRLFASAFVPTDALICRSIMAFTFFGACLGGLATSLLTFCFHCRHVWAAHSPPPSLQLTSSSSPSRPCSSSTSPSALRKGYYIYTAIGLPLLTASTAVGHAYCAAYLHWWAAEGRVAYGVWSHMLVLWALVDGLIEVKFLWWFHGYEGRYREKLGKAGDGEMQEMQEMEIWWVPKWRMDVLRVALAVWVAVMLALFGR